jgi:hypothetical protein
MSRDRWTLRQFVNQTARAVRRRTRRRRVVKLSEKNEREKERAFFFLLSFSCSLSRRAGV